MKTKYPLAWAALVLMSNPSQQAHADYPDTLKTPKGTTFPVIRRTYELTPSQIASYDNYARTTYPLASIVFSASRKYNCHSYAWYYRNGSNDIWINSPNQAWNWRDGSFRSTAAPDFNDNVTYCADDHSAVFVRSDLFQSKWGSLPRMRHLPTYSPYSAACLDYYR